jgi:hypothetical protein
MTDTGFRVIGVVDEQRRVLAQQQLVKAVVEGRLTKLRFASNRTP